MRSKRNSKSKRQNRENLSCETKCNPSLQTDENNHSICQHASSKVGPPMDSSLASSAGLVCSGCNKLIKHDKFVLKACDKYWHESCLKCDKCQAKLAELGNTLYCKSSMHLCRDDYLELFGPPVVCSVCNKMIRAYDLMMKAQQNVYHLECFACQMCTSRFYVGERFYLWENKIVCQYDYEEHVLQLGKSPNGGTCAKKLNETFPNMLADFTDQTGASVSNQLCDLDQSSYSNCVS